jgi:hypothetical protein
MKEKLYVFVERLPQAETGWVDLLSALLVPAIAVVGLFIAFQQYRINQQRLRHELYERRLLVYRSVQKYLSEVIAEGKTSFQKAAVFYSEASEASFLFDSSVQELIDRIYEKAIDMAALHEKLYPSDGTPGLPVGKERSQVAVENSQIFKWFSKQITESKQLFARKMGVKIT